MLANGYKNSRWSFWLFLQLNIEMAVKKVKSHFSFSFSMPVGIQIVKKEQANEVWLFICLLRWSCSNNNNNFESLLIIEVLHMS